MTCSNHRRQALQAGLAMGALLGLGGLGGCASPESTAQEASPIGAEDLSHTDWARASPLGGDTSHWQHLRFRGRKPSHYEAVRHAGRIAIHARSEGGSSVLRQSLLRPAAMRSVLAFSWWADALPADFDIRTRDTDDSVARVIVSFEGDRSPFTARDIMLSELAQLLTGEPLPHATLEYVWDAHLPAGTVVQSAYSTRVRYIVAESGPSRLAQWVDIERDVQADFARAFNEAPAAIVGVGVMTDANDTQGKAQAWFGPIRWV